MRVEHDRKIRNETDNASSAQSISRVLGIIAELLLLLHPCALAIGSSPQRRRRLSRLLRRKDICSSSSMYGFGCSAGFKTGREEKSLACRLPPPSSPLFSPLLRLRPTARRQAHTACLLYGLTLSTKGGGVGDGTCIKAEEEKGEKRHCWDCCVYFFSSDSLLLDNTYSGIGMKRG